MRYQTQAASRGDGVASVPNGLSVQVSSPLDPHRDPAGTDPEQLLALAWATCLNSTAQAVIARASRTTVRIEVELHDAASGSGFEFHVDAFLSVEGAGIDEAQRVLEAAHARCPISKLLRDAATVRVHAEEYSLS